MPLPVPLGVLDWIGSATAAIAGALGGVAAVVRFQAWWKDRHREKRLKSAEALRDSGSEDFLRAMGQRELDRIHFACLSNIDRPDGLKALEECHRELGGRDADWAALRGVGPRLKCRGRLAWIRRPRRKDYVALGVAMTSYAVAGVGSLALFGFMVRTVIAVLAQGPSLEAVLALILLGCAFAVTAMAAFFAASTGAWTWKAMVLRKRLHKVRGTRRGLGGEARVSLPGQGNWITRWYRARACNPSRHLQSGA